MFEYTLSVSSISNVNPSLVSKFPATIAFRIEDGEDEQESREWELQQIRNAGIVKTDAKKAKRSSAPVHRTIACKSSL